MHCPYTLKGVIFRGINFRWIDFRGINICRSNFCEFVIFKKFVESIFANFELLENKQSCFCDVLAFRAISEKILGENSEINFSRN